jgi:hypothetical protein
MGVNLWGVSPLYVNPVNVKSSWTLTKVLAEGKGGIARDRPNEKYRGHPIMFPSREKIIFKRATKSVM